MANDEQKLLISYIESIDEKITGFRKEYRNDKKSDRNRIYKLEQEHNRVANDVDIIKNRHDHIDKEETSEKWYKDRIVRRTIAIVFAVLVIFAVVIASVIMFGHELTQALLRELIK